MPEINIMALVSGSGTNLQALLDAEKAGALKSTSTGTLKSEFGSGKIALVVSDNPWAYALQRAKAAGIPAFAEEPDKNLPANERRLELSQRIFCMAIKYNISIIVLAGFLSILTGKILTHFSGRIINLHPSLLPKFGGEGMYGEFVHRAVLAAGEKESGCTVHFVNEGIDSGSILLQRKVPVLLGDTPDSLAKRVHEQEHIAIVESVKMLLGSWSLAAPNP